MLRRERYCRKHLTTWPKRTKVGDIFRCVMYCPQKHNFEMHICGFDFNVVNMEDDSFFSWGQVLNLRQGPKEQKIMVSMNPEGGARTAPRAPRLCEILNDLVLLLRWPFISLLHPYLHRVIMANRINFYSQLAISLIWTRNVGQCPTWWSPCRI